MAALRPTRLRSRDMPLPADQQADDTSVDEQAQAAEDLMLRQHAAIEQMISLRLRDAIMAREASGIEEIWFEDEDQYNGYDSVNRPFVGGSQVKDASTVSANDQRGSKRSTVFLNITKPKTDSAVSRVQEMLVPTDDRPWEVTSTPIPELSEAASSGDQTMHTLADGTQATAEDIAKAAMMQAQKSAELASTQIEDWFVEGNVYTEIRKVIRDAGRIGSGVLKGPFPVSRKDRKWNIQGGQSVLSMAERVAPTSRRIAAIDLFPDPSCGDNIHDGAFICERDYMTGRQIRALANIPDYDREALIAALKAGPGKRVRNNRYMRDTPGETQSFDSEVFEVFYYYGDIPPENLIAGGFVIEGLNDAENDGERQQQIVDALQLTTVPVVATIINDKLVRVTMNPLETGEFPYDVFPWEPVEGQPWGRGIPRKVAVAQRMLNAAVRAMLENAGMSAGPQVVIDKKRIAPANGIYEITGRKLWYWNPSDDVKDVRFAFASVNIDSAQAQLQAIIEFAQKMADELSNLPMLLQGIVGQTADTYGGMKMLEMNAASPLKAIAKQFDDTTIVPHLKRYYNWLMQDPAVDAKAKGDHQCRARGAGALASREQAGMFLQQTASLLGNAEFEINPKKWFEELARSNKFDPGLIQYTKDESDAIKKQREGQPPPMAPQVEAAHIRNDATKAQEQAQTEREQMRMAHEAQEANLDRQANLALREMEREIEMMEYGGRREISLESIRAMLAKAAMAIKNERDIFAAEQAFHAKTGEAVQ